MIEIINSVGNFGVLVIIASIFLYEHVTTNKQLKSMLEELNITNQNMNKALEIIQENQNYTICVTERTEKKIDCIKERANIVRKEI